MLPQPCWQTDSALKADTEIPEIVVPETVATMAVPEPPPPYATTKVFADSAVVEIQIVCAVLKTYSEPQVIVVPETVPAIAVP